MENKNSISSEKEKETTLAWCDMINKKNGKKLITWLRIFSDPSDPGVYAGIAPEPIIGAPHTYDVKGPNICVGKKYRILYSSPVRLPFIDPKEGVVVLHVDEITGTLLEPLALSNVELVVCQLDNYSIKSKIRTTRSFLRFFDGDKLEIVGEYK